MQLIVQPEQGINPILMAIKRAKKSIDVVVFRLDIKDIVQALGTAVTRGVAARALIAHTNRGGEKSLRKLEMELLARGVTVSRTADDLVRYHGKMMVIDGRVLHLYGFNFTRLDIKRSRSLGVMTARRDLVKEASKLFQADSDRQPYVSSSDRFVVSPENSRTRLAAFISGAKQQLLIYDPKVSDPAVLRLLNLKKSEGLDVRIIGSVAPKAPISAEKYPDKRLHVRAIVRDGNQAFIGSQSLRKVELDKRREIGMVISEKAVVRAIVALFEGDWAKTNAGRKSEKFVPDQHEPSRDDAAALRP
jgi:cardiolipin synthase A/B